jgi:hypothetical protein
VVHYEEAALMVGTVTVDQITVKGEKSVVAAIGVAKGPMVIHEEKVFAQLGRPESGRNTKLWILDTGATNHMTGSRAGNGAVRRRLHGGDRRMRQSEIHLQEWRKQDL